MFDTENKAYNVWASYSAMVWERDAHFAHVEAFYRRAHKKARRR